MALVVRTSSDPKPFIDTIRREVQAIDAEQAIRETGDLSEETEEKLKKELEHFQGVFNIEEEKGLGG